MSELENMAERFCRGDVTVDTGVSIGFGNDASASLSDPDVHQVWVERSIILTKAYTSIMSEEEVMLQYKTTDFPKLEQFLEYNALHHYHHSYVRVDSTVTILKTETVERVMQKGGDPPPKIGQCYYRAIPNCPKTKLLEVLMHFPWKDISIPGTDHVTLLMLARIFRDEEVALRFMVLIQSLGFGLMVNPETMLTNLSPHLKGYVSDHGLAIRIDPDFLKACHEWSLMVMDHIVSSGTLDKKKPLMQTNTGRTPASSQSQ